MNRDNSINALTGYGLDEQFAFQAEASPLFVTSRPILLPTKGLSTGCQVAGI